MGRRVLLRAVQVALLAAVLLLPLVVHTVALFLVCAGLCVAAAGAIGYWGTRGR